MSECEKCRLEEIRAAVHNRDIAYKASNPFPIGDKRWFQWREQLNTVIQLFDDIILGKELK